MYFINGSMFHTVKKQFLNSSLKSTSLVLYAVFFQHFCFVPISCLQTLHVRYVFEFCLLKIYSDVYFHGEYDADDNDDNTHCALSHLALLSAIQMRWLRDNAREKRTVNRIKKEDNEESCD